MHKALAFSAGIVLSVSLTGCGSGDAPTAWKEYALQGTYSASLSADSRFALTGSFNHGGSLWDVGKHERLYDWNHRNGEQSIIAASGFSPESSFAVTANQQDLVLWNTNNGQPIGFWSSPGEIMALDLSPQGDFALLGLANHEAVYFDVKNGGVRKTLRHSARVRSVDLSNDARFALTGSDDYKATLWNVEGATAIQQLTLGNVVDTVALAPNGRLAFSSGSLDKALIWETETGRVLHDLSETLGFFQKRVSFLSARFSSDSSQLLTGTASGTVQLWDVSSGTELRRWKLHKRDPYGPVHTGAYDVAFGSANTYYALGSNGFINEFR